MIAIGTVFRGPELLNSEIQRSIKALRIALKECRGPLERGSVPWVNVNWVVHGSLGNPGFIGLEYGKFSRKDKAVVVRIAVPEEVVKSGDHLTFLLKSLHEANAMAFKLLAEKGIEFPLAAADKLVELVATKLGTSSIRM